MGSNALYQLVAKFSLDVHEAGVFLERAQLESGVVRRSVVGIPGGCVAVVLHVASPGLPLLLTGWSFESDQSRGVRDSGVGLKRLLIESVDLSLSPSLPLFFSSHRSCFKGDKSRSIGESSVGSHGLVVKSVDIFLGPLLPLLLTPHTL